MGESSQIAEWLVSRSVLQTPTYSNQCQAPEWLVGPPEWGTDDAGALVIGGDYRGLGTVRSLGRRKIPVWVLTGEHLIAGVSRYARRRFIWPAAEEERQIEYLVRLGEQHNLRGWALFPSGDETAATIARHHAALRNQFRLTVPPWDVLQWAYDKRLTYRLASMVGVHFPQTHTFTCREEIARLECAFPAVLKPAVKPKLNRFTAAKAWRVEDRQSLLQGYDEASKMLDPNAIMIQELIPGSGEQQFSYAALCLDGRPLAALVARRTRQFPADFGRSSTFVETIDDKEIEEAGRRLVSAIGFTGLVEVEFKRDPRDGLHKLLDINPRIWGWHTLGRRAGIDFSFLLWRLIQGESLSERRGVAGVRWMRMSTDVAAAVAEMWRGRLSVGAYVKSLFSPVESAIFAADDPLPALLELPLGAYVILKRHWIRLRRNANAGSDLDDCVSRVNGQENLT